MLAVSRVRPLDAEFLKAKCLFVLSSRRLFTSSRFSTSTEAFSRSRRHRYARAATPHDDIDYITAPLLRFPRRRSSRL